MKLLVGYNASRASERALEVARDHAKAFNASVALVTSLSRSYSEKGAQNVEEAERALMEARLYLENEGIVCNTHVLIRGLSPGEDLVQFAEENEIDEIIVGVERQSKVGKLVMGSTAQYVILKSPCPVVSARP